MTADLVCRGAEMAIEEVAEMMHRWRVRHLPVIDEDEAVVGIVSIGDVNARRFTACEVALHQVQDYVFRRA